MKLVRSLVRFATAFALLITISSPLLAQRGGGFGFGRGAGNYNRAQLCSLKEVQADLKLSEDQKKTATEIYEGYQAAVREARQNAGGDFQAMMEKSNKLAAEATAKVIAKLDDAQKARLNQILVQVNSANALLDSDIQKALKITEEQAKKLTDAQTANREAMMSAFQGAQGASPEEMQKKMAELRKASDDRFLACISSDQKAEFEKMSANKLEVDLSPLAPRRPNN